MEVPSMAQGPSARVAANDEQCIFRGQEAEASSFPGQLGACAPSLPATLCFSWRRTCARPAT
eukprot:6180801-Amphidinium_carterae.1